ncbi:hypothetical protein [Streptomyces alfalfae]|uniref:Uncharacterized protein n=1 Tax=Streptomyces alfalfae TaxID=1642299 RepID=A0A7T4PLT0_9ACTN|nr:hypothetical protein [Streptomyces alfalfae]QQC92677.1 hypothetical protein I8755_33140 [Streptomyces alfalfae]
MGIDDIILSYSSDHWLGPWHDDSVQRWDIGMHFKDEGPGPCFGTIELYTVDHSHRRFLLRISSATRTIAKMTKRMTKTVAPPPEAHILASSIDDSES